jgi:cell division protein FtsL
MRKLATLLLGCVVLCASVVPTHAQRKERLIEQEKREKAIRQKQARKAEEEEMREENLRAKIQKTKKARALAADRGEDTTSLDEEIEALKRETAEPGTE